MPGLSLGALSAQLGGPSRSAGGGAGMSDPLADAATAAPWRPPDDGRTESQRLRALLEHGVGASFDLRAWCGRDSCALSASQRLELLLEQCRPEVAKLIVMEQLEADGKEDVEELTYGEITNEAFIQLLRHHAATGSPPAGSGRRTFYDLGSGTGKTALLAAASGYFTAAKGIELLPCVGAIGTALAEEFTHSILPDLCPGSGGGRGLACKEVSLTVGDMFVDTDWVGADFVYTCTMMFGPELMQAMADVADGMRPGAIFATVMLPLPSSQWEIVCEEPCRFSWGSVEIFVHRKKKE